MFALHRFLGPRQIHPYDNRAILLILFVVFAANTAFAMGGKPDIDPACFESDTLRVEIGGERFEFPRKMVSNIRGKDVVHPQDPIGESVSGSKACQKLNDSAWKLNYISLDLYPKPCASDAECRTMRIDTYVTEFYEDTSPKLSESRFPYTKAKLLEECKPPIKPFSDYHAKVWSSCDFVFIDSNLRFWIKFRGGGGIYPPEEIEITKQLVLNEIKKYSVTH